MSGPIAITNATVDGRAVTVRLADGAIAALGPDVLPEPADTLLDAEGAPVFPGLVNGHTHAAMTLFRGWGDDLPLMEWLEQRIWPAEAKLVRDDVYWGTRLAIAEMLRSGTVRCWDMYWHADAVVDAVRDSGIRATVSSVVIDGGDATRAASRRPAILDALDTIAAGGPRVTGSLGPHAVYTVSAETLMWLGEVSADRDVAVQIHCAETREEVAACRDAHGVSPVGLLDRCGVLTPRAVLAHCVWLDDADLDLIAERGATVVTNPVSNMKLAVGGVFRYEDARRRGIPVGLGTDGAASNNSLDLLADAKVLALLHKHTADDPAAMPAPEAWAVASGVHAPMLGQSGRLAPGDAADLVVLRPDRFELGPGELLHNLVYAASGAVVRHVLVDGRVVVRDGRVDGEEEITARAFECAARLGVRRSASAM